MPALWFFLGVLFAVAGLAAFGLVRKVREWTQYDEMEQLQRRHANMRRLASALMRYIGEDVVLDRQDLAAASPRDRLDYEQDGWGGVRIHLEPYIHMRPHDEGVTVRPPIDPVHDRVQRTGKRLEEWDG